MYEFESKPEAEYVFSYFKAKPCQHHAVKQNKNQGSFEFSFSNKYVKYLFITDLDMLY